MFDKLNRRQVLRYFSVSIFFPFFKLAAKQKPRIFCADKEFSIANAIDCNLRFARDARWDIVKRSMEILEAGFIKKMNNDYIID